ncbi:hypothetical protein ABG980_02770 [Enterococcus casseliflavus]|jgi:hypothetical protein|nr:hypothetical protein [Enterococcus casseliflavus]MDB1696151.1 hypothetical protein [Enterococcus casseliflavus]MDB1699753.1 hypothetical protein [Enterococcus casseliflavus]MDB1702303.1 hypothetical protein [Enterococcus casseliflavus]MDB1704595.1 hypothetical protein [Enterococcus casseliflavus]
MKDIIVILVALISIGFAAWGTVVEGNWMKDQIKKNNDKKH